MNVKALQGKKSIRNPVNGASKARPKDAQSNFSTETGAACSGGLAISRFSVYIGPTPPQKHKAPPPPVGGRPSAIALEIAVDPRTRISFRV
eukprot:scaffold346259_cov17-Prasinocladus_malaysianus.AAC.1